MQNSGATAVTFEGGALPASRFAHNTVAGNSALGLQCPSALVVLQSIVFANGSQINGACDAAESIVQGGRSGFDNTGADPQFVDDAGGDFHLRATSPAKDAAILSVQALDADGVSRDAFPDVGAFELP